MTELLMRSLFMLACAGLGYQIADLRQGDVLYGTLAGIAMALVFIAVEVFLSKRPIQSISAVVFGLITGCLLAIVFNYAIAQLIISEEMAMSLNFRGTKDLQRLILLSLIVSCCFLCVMVIYRTRDRFRFIIPYVEFQKEEKGASPILIDTSAVIDGRLAELCETRILDTTLVVPKFVLQELQHVADSGDRLRRNRGRRGLEMLQRLQRDERIAVQIHDGRLARGSTVDSKLVSLASQLQARILTCDYNLSKLAEIQNVDAVNLNDLTNALRPIVLPGEELALKIMRPGDEPGQGVGYLADGTMVVVDQGRDRQGQTVNMVVTSTLQTSAGRMVFGRLRHDAAQNEEKVPHKRRGEREKKA